MIPSRWEHGSEYHWLDNPTVDEPCGTGPWGEAGVYCASGRDALRLLIAYGMSKRGWRTLWVPSYMCQTVVRSIAQTDVTLRVYPDDPRQPSPCVPSIGRQPGNVVLVVNHFGVRTAAHDTYPCDVIEDHTHDPWSSWACGSTATYCVASLRKTLPIPDGAVAWSPTGQGLPEEPGCTDDAVRASALRLSAALMKRHYLEGGPVSKAAYLRLFREGESVVGRHCPSGMTPWAREQFASLPVGWWRRRRKEGWSELERLLSELPFLTILRPRDASVIVPFGVVMIMRNALSRDRLLEHLHRHNVYATVLWHIKHDSASPACLDDSVALSERVLFVHCDGRYDRADHARVAKVVAHGI